LQRPDLVQAVISLSGVPPPADLVKDEKKLRGFPVFAAHGEHDPLIPIALGRAVRDELVRLGLAVDWHEYPMGHMVVPEELDDARTWLKKLL